MLAPLQEVSTSFPGQPSFPPRVVARDPGTAWIKDSEPAIDAPPDCGARPSPEATWPREAVRTGVCGAVTPDVVALPEGGYRMYYTQILPRAGFPAGANDYETATTRILSAVSSDAVGWTPEAGVRLSPQEGGAGEFRVVSPEVVPLAGGTGKLRMYYECCPGPRLSPSSLRSALSEDGGTTWRAEPGERLAGSSDSYVSPRLVFLDDGRLRLYCGLRGVGIVSALSEDGGLTFHREPGVRIAMGSVYDGLVAFSPMVLRIEGAGYRMYYAGYAAPNRAYVLGAVSEDGLAWRKEAKPVISPGGHGSPGCGWDAAKCSEVCVVAVRGGYRMLYEACDGTAEGERGVWRIAGATAALRPESEAS